MGLLILGASLAAETDIVPVELQRLLIVGVGREIQPQLVDGEIERHQLGEGRVRRGEAALQLPVKRQIQTGEERPLLQGLLVIVARGIVGLGGDERKGHRTAAAGQRAAVAAAGGRGYGAGRCRRRRFFGIQRVFLLLTSSSGGAAAAHASV